MSESCYFCKGTGVDPQRTYCVRQERFVTAPHRLCDGEHITPNCPACYGDETLEREPR